MKTITLTYEQAKADLLALVDEVGADHIYDMPEEVGQCVYFAPDRQPSCIVGHLAARHGVTYEDWAGVNEDYGAAMLFDDGIVEPRDYADLDRLRTLLVEAQNLQDGKTPWGRAVHQAIESAEA